MEKQILQNKEASTQAKITAEQGWSTARVVHSLTHCWGHLFGRGAGKSAAK